MSAAGGARGLLRRGLRRRRCHAAASDPAAGYPNKPIRFIVPFAAGAGTDTTARTIAQKLTEKWGQQVVVDNRTGAGGAIGVDFTAKAIPDGYTICLISASNSVNSATNPEPALRPGERPPGHLAGDLALLRALHPSVGAGEIGEGADRVREGESRQAQFRLVRHGHAAALLRRALQPPGRREDRARAVQGHRRGHPRDALGRSAGRLRLAHRHAPADAGEPRARRSRSPPTKRSPAVDLPTVAESGLPGYEVDQWYGVITSSKVPQADRDEAERRRSSKRSSSPTSSTRLATDGSTPVGSTPEQFNAHIKSEIAKWKRLVKEANLQLDNK